MGRRARRSEPQLLPAGMTASQLFPSLASLTLSASSKAREGALGTIRSGAQIIMPPSTEVSAGAKHSTEQLTDPSSSNPNIHPGGWYCECPHFTGKETEVKGPVQDHIARQLWDGHSNPGLRAFEAHSTQ